MDEALWARAEANGYAKGAYREADERRDQEKHVDKTKKNQNGTLRRYILWHLGAARRQALRESRPPPDEETVHYEHLREDAPAPALATVKDFLRFYIATSRPRLHERPTVDSINIVAEWFFAGFTRVTGTDTDEGERSEVYNWVRRTLTREGIVVNKHRPKHNFTERDLTRVFRTLWTRDDLIFIPERYRIQTTFIINVYCWTGARIGAFFTDGLRYKDVELVLQRENGRRWRLIYKVDQRWVKNNRDPENIVFRATTKEHGKLCYNDAGMLLIMALADGALFGYETLEDVQRQEIPTGQDELHLRFNDSALDRPILRQCTKAEGVLEKPMPRKRHTAVERSQHITQADPAVFGQSYVANCSSVDGQAAFHGEDGDHRHIEYFQSLERFHEEGLPDKLPACLEEKLLRDPELCKLDGEARKSKLNASRQRYTNLLKKLKLAALRQYQQNWIRERRDWKVLTGGKEAPQDKSKTDFLQDVCLMVPERGRLARHMAADHRLDPEDMWLALQDLQSLCVQDFTVLYLPGTRPVDGACPIKCCQASLETIPKSQRNQHIQSCVRLDLAYRLSQLQTDVHYCHQCFDWVIGKEWEPHCASHLANTNSKRCGAINYCHTLVRPGYCPFCLGDPDIPASERLKSWTRDHKLWNHVDRHLAQSRWPRSCPHPLCDTVVDGAVTLQFHFMDEHDLSRACPGKPALSTDCQSQEKKMSLYTEGECESHQHKRKRRRQSSSGKLKLEWMSPEPSSSVAIVEADTSQQSLPKRPRLSPPTMCPEELSADERASGGLVKLSIIEPTASSLQCSESLDRLTDPDSPSLPSSCLSPFDAMHILDPAGDDCDALFEQYLRLPSPSPSPPISPGGASSHCSGWTLVSAGYDQSWSSVESVVTTSGNVAAETVADNGPAVRERERLPHGALDSRIRLRVNRPKITLRLKLQGTTTCRTEKIKPSKPKYIRKSTKMKTRRRVAT